VSGCPKAITLILQVHGESKGHALAKLIMPGDDPGDIIVTMLWGIVGAVVGGFLGSRFFGRGHETFWNLQSWIVAIIESLILLGIYRLVIATSRAVSR
jgi:uncharacterized membrane protein YeaQ/YmgE (transglycosylase-associated protein family)